MEHAIIKFLCHEPKKKRKKVKLIDFNHLQKLMFFHLSFIRLASIRNLNCIKYNNKQMYENNTSNQNVFANISEVFQVSSKSSTLLDKSDFPFFRRTSMWLWTRAFCVDIILMHSNDFHKFNWFILMRLKNNYCKIIELFNKNINFIIKVYNLLHILIITRRKKKFS